jgi:hypothetical protein
MGSEWGGKGLGSVSSTSAKMVYECFGESFEGVSRFHRVSRKDVNFEQLFLSLALVRCEVVEAQEKKYPVGANRA